MPGGKSRTAPERQNALHGPRDEKGRLVKIDAMRRFIDKCEFDPRTGCVLWIGGTTRGRGNTATYGSFWYEGRRWFAHRFAAKFIHGLDIDGLTVGHCCPNNPDGKPNTLCVQHIEGQTLADNVAERNTRVAAVNRAAQSAHERQHWLFTEIGLREPEPLHDPAMLDDLVPFHSPPDWLTLDDVVNSDKEDCPF